MHVRPIAQRALSEPHRLVSTRTSTPNGIAELLPEFTIMLQATNRSPRTIELYVRGVGSFERFCRDRGMPTAVDAVSREHIEAFFAWMLGEGGYAAASAKAYYDGIRQFFGWAEEEGEVADGRNPMRHVRPPKVIAQPPDVLTVEQIRSFSRRASEGRSKTGGTPRSSDSCTTPESGSQCSGLAVDDVDLADRREIRVLGKGQKERTVPFGAASAQALGRYLRLRRGHPQEMRPDLWLGLRGPMTPSGV
jgi:integrase/recombinase XerD